MHISRTKHVDEVSIVVMKYVRKSHWDRNLVFRSGNGFGTLVSNSLLFASRVLCMYMHRDRENTKRKLIFTARVKMHIMFRKLYAPALPTYFSRCAWLCRLLSLRTTAGLIMVPFMSLRYQHNGKCETKFFRVELTLLIVPRLTLIVGIGPPDMTVSFFLGIFVTSGYAILTILTDQKNAF